VSSRPTKGWMMTPYEKFRAILIEAREAGIIEDFAECPGVDRIDIIPQEGAESVSDWIQVEVIR
jgi:hypothetical protein